MKRLPVSIDEDEFLEVIGHTRKEHHKLAFLLGFASGLRVSEVCKLRPENINMKERTISIIQGKGGKDRTVPLPKRGFKEKHLGMLPFKCGARALEIAFRNACKAAGLLKTKPGLHFHSLRHGFASQCVRNGMDVNNIRILMGHTNIATTSVYFDLNPKHALEAYNDKF